MDALRQSLYGLNLAPYVLGAFTFAAFFVLLMRKRVRIMNPRRLWILPGVTWIVAVIMIASALPQTGTQVVAFVVLAITGFGIGVLLCLSDSLKLDPETDVFTHTSSLLSVGAASLIIALLVGSNPTSFWPAAVFISGFVTGQSVCLWRWSEVLRKAPEAFHPGM